MHEKAIAEGFDSLWGKSLERNWVLGRLGLPGGGSPVFNAPDKPGYKYVQRGAEGEEGQVIALDRIGVADVYNQRVRMRREFGEYVIREAEYLDSSGGLSNTLAGLTDVAITGLADGDIIQYDSGLGEWINAAAGGGGGTTYFAGDAIDIDGSNNISVKVNSSSAIVVDTGSNTLLVNVGDGLKITLNQLTLNLAPSPGLEYGTGVDAGKLRVDTGDGITIDASGIALNFATDPGLELVLGGGVYKVRVKEYFGIERSSNGIGVKLKTTSGLEVDIGGLAIQDAIAGNGLVIASKILAVGAGDGIDSNANDVAVDVTDFIDTAAGLKEDLANNIQVKLEANSGLQFGGVGGVQLGTPSTLTVSTTNLVTAATHAHAITSSPDVGTSLATVILAASAGTLGLAQLTIRGNLIFAGGNRSITASNSLTITPSTDLILDPTGLILTPNAQDIRTVTINDLPTGIDGYRIWNRYANYTQLTIGAIKADELYIRVFVADETRIDRGEEYWSKSFGIVQEDFTLPAINSTVDVWFEDAPAAVTFNLFAVNDYLLCRTIDWSTGLVVQKIWFQVTVAKLAQETTAVNGVDRQQWRIKRLAGGATGNLIKRGNLALDTGQIGQGWIHLSALSQDGGPFIQIGTMTSVSTVPQFTNYVRMGNLNGTVDYATNVYGFAAGSSLGTTPSGGFSGLTAEATNGLRLFNTDIAFYDSGIKITSLTGDDGLAFVEDSSLFSHANRFIGWWGSLSPTPNGFKGGIGLTDDGSTTTQLVMQAQTPLGSLTHPVVWLSAYELDLAQQFNVWLEIDKLTIGTGVSHVAPNLIFRWTRTGKYGVGIAPVSVGHFYESTAATDGTAGVTIEQDSTGDALLQFLLTSTRRWVVGIDNSDADKFKISNNAALGTGDVLTIDLSDRIGIGTSAPASLLHIVQPSTTEYALSAFNTNAAGTFPVASFGLNASFALQLETIVGSSLVKHSFGVTNNGTDYPDMLVLDRGNIGIGTASPTSMLHIVQPSSTTYALSAFNTNAAGTFPVARWGLSSSFALELQTIVGSSLVKHSFGVTNNGTDYDDMLVLDRGFIGIGTASPASLLHVYENTTATTTAAGVTIEQAGTGDAKLRFLLTGGQRWGVGIDNSDGDKFKIASGTDLGTTPALTITTNGYLGIGVAAPGVDVIATTDIAPTSLIHLDGNTGNAALVISADSGAAISIIGDNAITDTNWLHISQNNGISTIQSLTNGGSVAEVFFSMDHATGYVGVNNTAPDARFDVDTEDNNGIRSTVYSATNWFNYVARRANGTKASPTRALLNTIIGSWGGQGYTLSGWGSIASAQIQMRAAENYTATAQGSKIEFYTTLDGTTTISKAVTIENDGALFVPYIWNHAVNGTAVQVDSNGLLTKATSSIRFKKNVREMPGEYGDDFIMALKPIIYNNKFGDDAGDYLGFVAEDVFGIGGKSFVSFNDAGQVESLHYDKLTVPLVAAVQDLIPYKARIAQLEAEMSELRARVSAIEGA
jgi:hypothetical protein